MHFLDVIKRLVIWKIHGKVYRVIGDYWDVTISLGMGDQFNTARLCVF